jgi:hypothetical protein
MLRASFAVNLPARISKMEAFSDLPGDLIHFLGTYLPSFQAEVTCQDVPHVEIEDDRVHSRAHLGRPGQDPEVDVLDPIPKRTDVDLVGFEHFSQGQAGVA